MKSAKPKPIVSSTGEKLYIVEKIVGERQANGRLEYLIGWKGYKRPTWEPATVIHEDAPAVVRKWQESQR